MYDDEDSVFTAMRAGARGYLVKGVEQEDIARAIRSVAAGEAIFGPGVAQRVLRFLTAPTARTEAVFPDLTPREHEILGLIAEGLSNREIGERLFVSENTVKTHSSRLFDKMGVNRRTQAVQKGKEFGLIP
jgi:DNA-binding NarL/FixJ family response regulator